MVKLNIDTGVEEFEINGGEAAGGGVLRFNPSDPNVYNRFFEARDRLIEMDQEIGERQQALRDETASDEDKAAAFLKVLREYDVKIKSLLSEVFGPENDFDRILGGRHQWRAGRDEPAGGADPHHRSRRQARH